MHKEGSVRYSSVSHHSKQADRNPRAHKMDEHLRRKDVVCTAALLLESEALTWSVPNGAEVDAGQVVGSAGLIERGNLHQLLAPCRGKLRIQKLDNGKQAAAAVNGATTAGGSNNDTGDEANAVTAEKNAGDGGGGDKQTENGDVVVAFVEYCIHPLKSGRTCMMCLEVVDENEEDIDGERRSVNVVSHGQVLRLNIEEASTSRAIWIVCRPSEGELVYNVSCVVVCCLLPQRDSTRTTLSASLVRRSCHSCWTWTTRCCTPCA